MFGISYLMEFKEIRVNFLFNERWKVPVNMCFTLLKLLLDNFPMIILKIIFLLDKRVERSTELASIILSAILSVLSALIFGLILIKKVEDWRFSLESKGVIGCFNYIRQDLEEFLGLPPLSLDPTDIEHKGKLVDELQMKRIEEKEDNEYKKELDLSKKENLLGNESILPD